MPHGLGSGEKVQQLPSATRVDQDVPTVPVTASSGARAAMSAHAAGRTPQAASRQNGASGRHRPVVAARMALH